MSARQNARSEMKEKMKSGLAEKDFTYLELSTKEYQDLAWMEENEISYKGEMYDLIKLSQGPEGVILKVISDEKESKILDSMKQQDEQNSPVKQKTQLFQLFLSLYNSDFQIWKCPHFISIKDHSTLYLNNYSSLIPELSTPPPRAI